ncbi:uncharacterized protein LOC108193364 [Daucus carota subsp. sativus]|uniref:uncharacterized protein LOC108193364 n=1 Tax=Daucus carota subsp. sativus TaxID=79200 RepID=UPI0007EF4295|nr:PREDICTED: uncharacterized protein LOC108193364 [Daucus carota subsp. sativus]
MAIMKARTFFGVSLSLIIINLVAVMERADENLLPSVYKEVSEAFGAGPADLGYLSFTRNFVRGISSPLAGVLVINYDRSTVLATGTFFWAFATAAVGASRHFRQVAFWRAVNGFGLAIVIPALQSFIADSYKDAARGAGFGFLHLIGHMGGIGGGVLATVMAGHEFWGMPGWRCAFILMATLSALIGYFVLLFVVDPRRTDPTTDASSDREALVYKDNISVASVWMEALKAMKAVVKVKTFRIIVLQGLVGSLPWTSMVFFTLWFQLIGFDHNSTASLLSLFAAGVAMGSFLGGALGDRISRVYPNSGRILCAQFSAFMGIPFTWFLLRVIPQSVSSYYTFAITLFLMGLSISWCNTAANAPMFAEVVPAKNRTMIYAFDRACEGSFSAFAAPMVGILSEKLYGYNPKSVDPTNGSLPEALALSKGLFTMMAVPFGLCCLFYTPAHWFFRRDRLNVRMASLKETELI